MTIRRFICNYLDFKRRYKEGLLSLEKTGNFAEVESELDRIASLSDYWDMNERKVWLSYVSMIRADIFESNETEGHINEG